MRNKLFIFGIFLFVLFAGLGLSSSANATIITFSNKAAFLTATSATSATGPLPDLGLIPGGASASITVGSVTFSIAPPSSGLFIGTAGRSDVINNDWTLRLPGPDIAISDVENLNVDLVSPLFSFGFDFVEPQYDPQYAPFVDSTFTVTLKNSGVIVDSFTFNAWPHDTPVFIGVWGGTAFNRVEIRETVGGIDDEYFGQFYTGTTPVPEPATMLLLGSGLIGLAGYGRKRLFKK